MQTLRIDLDQRSLHAERLDRSLQFRAIVRRRMTPQNERLLARQGVLATHVLQHPGKRRRLDGPHQC